MSRTSSDGSGTIAAVQACPVYMDRQATIEKDWINPGESVIVDPDGKIVAGPASREETILYAELDRAKITGPRWQLDLAGHYARPDIFELIVHRKAKPLVTKSQEE